MTEKTISLTTYYYKKGEIDNAVVKITDVKDNLTSTDTNKPLSANQGKELKALVDGKAASVHTHSKKQITDFSHTHGNLQNDGQVGSTAQASKNVVTDTNGKITTEEKYSHPASHPASMITGLANVATSGSYNDLSNKPFIPTKTSDLTNDSNFLTQHQDISGKANTSDLSDVAFSGSYTDLTDKPTIPVDVSDLTDTQNTAFTPKTHTHNEYLTKTTADTYYQAIGSSSAITSSDLTDVDIVDVVVTYTDTSTETLPLIIYKPLLFIDISEDSRFESLSLGDCYLYDSYNNNTDTVSNNNGQYVFKNIPYGEYHIIIDADYENHRYRLRFDSVVYSVDNYEFDTVGKEYDMYEQNL